MSSEWRFELPCGHISYMWLPTQQCYRCHNCGAKSTQLIDKKTGKAINRQTKLSL